VSDAWLERANDPAFSGGFVQHLGVRYTELGPDRVEATWTVRPDLHQPFGILHGGVHCSVVETLASMGAAAWLTQEQPDGQVVGVHNGTDFYRAAREGEMTSVATPVHRGRLQQVWLVETTDEQGRLVARGQVRLQNLQPR
jgi:uncharacterized protein (TIGR00369 family)